MKYPSKETIKSAVEYVAKAVLSKNIPIKLHETSALATLIADNVISQLERRGYYQEMKEEIEKGFLLTGKESDYVIISLEDKIQRFEIDLSNGIDCNCKKWIDFYKKIIDKLIKQGDKK